MDRMIRPRCACLFLLWVWGGSCSNQPPVKKPAKNDLVKTNPAQSAIPTPAAPKDYLRTFEKDKIGSEPEDLFSVDGVFTVREHDGRNVLQLASAPLGTFQLLFGPPGTENVRVEARMMASRRGRRKPALGIGIGGISGYVLKLKPQARRLELLYEDAAVHFVPWSWQSDVWYVVRLEAIKKAPDAWLLRGKVWPADETEPAAWTLTHEASAGPAGGRPSLLGIPHSGKPILYDRLGVHQLGPSERR